MTQERKKLKVYTTSWCPDCRVAKRFLDQYNVEYEEINIDTSAEAEALVIAASGGRRVIPTIDAGGKFYFNPPLLLLAKELNLG